MRRFKLGGPCLVAMSFGLTLVVQASASDPKKIAYGRHLSGECATCHRPDGPVSGIPSITGRDADEFIKTLGLYRNGERNNPAMVSVAQSLDDDQIKALAAYFGSLPKGSPIKK
jgi:cytochrome c